MGGACNTFDALRLDRSTPFASKDSAGMWLFGPEHSHPFKTLNYSTVFTHIFSNFADIVIVVC